MRLSCPKRWIVGFAARIAPLRDEQSLSEVKQQRRGAEVAGVNQIEIDSLADDSFDSCVIDGPTSSGLSVQHRVLVEVRV